MAHASKPQPRRALAPDRRSLIKALLCAAVVAAGAGAKAAAAPPLATGRSAPSGSSCYTPGGSTDIVTRIVMEKLGPRLGQTIIVENRPGANGSLRGGRRQGRAGRLYLPQACPRTSSTSTCTSWGTSRKTRRR